MAIGTPAVLKDNGAIASSGQATVAVTGVVIPAGTLVTVHIAGGAASGAVVDPTGVSDGTNAYAKDDSSARSTENEAQFSFYDAAGGTRTITVTLGTSCNYTHVVVVGTSGAATSSVLDQNSGGDQGGTTSVTVVSVGNIAQADEASLAAVVWGTSTALSSTFSGYGSLVNATNATRGRGHHVGEKTPLTAGSPETASATLGSATSWAGVMGTYKGASGGGGTDTVAFNTTGESQVGWTTSGTDTLAFTTTGGSTVTWATSGTDRIVVTVASKSAVAFVTSGSDTIAFSSSGVSRVVFAVSGSSTTTTVAAPGDFPLLVLLEWVVS